jgi:hypothetical protein
VSEGKTDLDYDLRIVEPVEDHRERRLLDAPSVSPEQPYRFENGTLYVPPTRQEPPFIPDRGFDWPA